MDLQCPIVVSQVAAAAAAVAGSVPGLVLVVPSVEIIVEEHDASGCHAGYDAPSRSKEGTS